jgi:hypothetical protein
MREKSLPRAITFPPLTDKLLLNQMLGSERAIKP